MNADQSYICFIKKLKQNIVQSRYIAARLANKEQLLLYLRTGKMLADTIKREKWGAKVLDRISEDLQHELPGIKGFSAGNLKKIRVVAEAYNFLPLIGSTPSNQLRKPLMENDPEMGATILNQLAAEEFVELFFSITFSHHFLILTKVKDWQERVNTHNLDRLIRYGSLVSFKLPHIFPQNTDQDKRLFKLLQHAYSDARYNEDYSIDFVEVEQLTRQINELKEEVVSLCKGAFTG